MDDNTKAVLVVDDDQFNLDLIEDYLSEEDIQIVSVNRGEKALSLLRESPEYFSAILLDRMMPGMNGMEVLAEIKSDEKLKRIPVIMQTAKTGNSSMLEGLKAGAHYYLSKPYGQQTLTAIVSTAIRDYQHYIELQETVKHSAQTLQMMDKGQFVFKSIDEGRKLAALLANACPDPERIVFGLTELIINAVEHGNLGISYDEKTKLNLQDQWENLINSRLSSPSCKDKTVTVDFERSNDEIVFMITDQGDGFEWKDYMEISPKRAFDSHGRGIALANSISFNRIQYLERGNRVCATVSLANDQKLSLVSAQL